MRNISNLFLCGGRIPGVCGVPGAVLSGKALTESVAKEFVAVAPYERLADIAARSVA
jgi:hypothetical protein